MAGGETGVITPRVQLRAALANRDAVIVACSNNADI
mgnify:CR=1 FL=1